MTASQQKMVRDFWQERTRTALVVLAIAMGIAGFSAVMSSYAILTRELDRGYLATNPASATLRTDVIDDQLLATVLSDREVSDAEPRRVVSGRIKVGPAEWRNLVIFVVKDYGNIRVSRLVPERGAWPPSAGEILIERDAMQVARAKIGDSVTVKTTAGSEQSLRIGGTVHDVGQAQARMENLVYGYITLDTLSLLGEQPYLDQLNILVARDRFDEAHVTAVAARVKSALEAHGHAVRRVDVPKPGKHPHAEIMGLLLLSMSTFGLFVLVLSGVLVFNLLTALMASQMRQIGMMKAVGGTARQISRIYFGQALFLGVAALVLALPLGNLGARWLCRYLAVFLNFDISSFAVPAWVYLLVAIVGLIAPLAAAAKPILRGTQVSVREALSDFGVARANFGVTSFDRRLAGVGGSMRPLLLALRNSFRQRTRLKLTLVTLSVSGLFFMAALTVRASLIKTLDHLFAARQYDLSVSFGALYPYEKVERAMARTRGIVRAEGWISTEGSLAGSDDSSDSSAAPKQPSHNPGGATVLHGGGSAGGGDRFTILAIPPGTKMLKLDIASGRDLAPGDTDAIVINTAVRSKGPEMRVGNTVNLRIGPSVRPWKIVGLSREPFSPALAYIPRALFDELHPGSVSTVRMVLDQTDPASINSVKAALDRNLEQEGIRAVASQAKGDGRYSFDQHMLMIYVFLIIMSCILAAVGGLGLMTTMSLNVLERRREMGVLRAIGATPAAIWRIVMAEGVAIGLMSWAIAALAAYPVSNLAANGIGMHVFRTRLAFAFDTRAVFLWLAVSLTLGLIASFLPAWNASRCPVREAVNYE